MTNTKMHRQFMDKEVQHSKTQAEALSLRGVGQRTLHQSEDRLSLAQVALFAKMRDDGTKICVTGVLGQPPDDPAALNAFLSARLARGREVTRAPDFQKMPPLARTTAVRSLLGGHVEWIANHPDNTHQFYGLSERGLALLAQHGTRLSGQRNSVGKL
jgi:hypothetical protein